MHQTISNAVKGVASGKPINRSLNAGNGARPTNTLARNAVSNLDAATNGCPVVSECKNMIEGVAKGDFKKAATNGGLLSLYSLASGAAGGSQKVVQAASTGSAAAKLGVAATLNNVVGNSSGE